MITKFEKYNESLRDLMVGPTEDEVLDSLKDLSPDELLIKSCEIGFNKGVELALDRGADINTNYGSGFPITISSINGYYDIVKYLLENGAEVNNSMGFSINYTKKLGYNEIHELLKSYMNKSTNESVQTELVIEVTDKDDDFINKLVDKLSFIYKKRKDRHTRPIKITGRMIPDIELNVLLSNKDNLKIEYLDKEDLKIHINKELIYYDDVTEDKLIHKILDIYTKYLNKLKFKIKGGHPF